ncbi:hypothetical protein A3724_05910 [Alcanivorax sp. HI0033]|uniref:tetratricopeptide repeat-containing sulfotransferase family protein n=1 Tax=unclassified Alcanivorax TaxID=2638842 RepID=UPI0007BA698A|nr:MULTISPECIES: sulfotransferase [unclassified Alcanivorax]KZX73777.1 hypothetical protein A3717_03515 [Alcanivorax sp. HI0013]KZX81599.1 hypothetical protein A3716_00705 [Alcanivorax sp. HI0011]KZY16133.1 hypothetical protein A3725_00655 [Alcanivorax sp. HI0035]KZX63749.1 hypothetical protein A3713_05280 [Alcanivorax sp. HI0003]KZX70987.1 hypothetical protein A3714_00780 [Alcanivorax sp. HI0007]
MNQTPNIQALVRQAASLLQQGFSQKAQQVINLAFQQGATSGVAWDIYAQACANLNQVQPAILGLKKAISLDGGRLDRALLLGQMLIRAEQWQEAANIYQQVIQQDDSQAKAWFGLGESLLGTKDVERALRCFSRALDREPGFPEARQRLAVCFLEKGEALKSLRLLEQLVSDFPDAVGPKVDYGEALRQANRYRQAQIELENLQDHPVVGTLARRRLVDVYLHIGEYDRAERFLDDVDSLHQKDPDWILQRVRLDNIHGRNAEACERLRLLLQREPGIANGWKQLMELTRSPLSDEELSCIKEQARLAGKFGRQAVAADFHFAMAFHFELSGEKELEFRSLEKGNNLKHGLIRFDFDNYISRVLPSRECYSAEKIREWAVDSNTQSSPAPIFILSLPRSGSTLVEQILGVHEDAEATGESDFAEQAWFALTGERSLFSVPDLHREMSAGKVQKFRQYYLEAAAAAGFDTRKRLVNKGINNHKFAGLLKAAFPEASFIDLRRNMMDVAFGCYRQNFASQLFSFSMDGCAREVALFYDNMAFWYSQLPAQEFHSLQYESLVSDFEPQVRKLLAYCGLTWDARCLEFQNAKGKVSTASINQVSQGLFTQGVARWKKYEEYLGPMVDALRSHGLEPLPD